jgi:hypothetical protein
MVAFDGSIVLPDESRHIQPLGGMTLAIECGIDTCLI